MLHSLFLFLFIHLTFGEIQKIQKPQFQYHGNGGFIGGSTKPVICSISSGSLRRPKFGFSLSKIDAKLCTHILYSSARIGANSKVFIGEKKDLIELKDLKYRVPLILSIGGWDEGVKNFQRISRNESALEIFSTSIKTHLSEYSPNAPFESICIAWMWPGLSYRGGVDRDGGDLLHLLKHLHTHLPTTPISLLLNGEVSNVQNLNLTLISPLIQHFLLLAQDYAGNWEGVKRTSHPAPLFGEKSVDGILGHVLQHIASPSQLILGLPFFGRTFLLEKEDAEGGGLNESFKGSFPSTFYDSNNEMAYAEICKMGGEEGAEVYWDNEAKGMFLKLGRKWVGFDGLLGMRAKVEYGMEKGLGGFFINFADTDDFDGAFCGGQKWPLLKGVVRALRGGNGSEEDCHSTTHLTHPSIFLTLLSPLLLSTLYKCVE